MYGMYRRRFVGATITSSMNSVDSVVASSAVELRDSKTQKNESATQAQAIHHFSWSKNQACSQNTTPQLHSTLAGTSIMKAEKNGLRDFNSTHARRARHSTINALDANSPSLMVRNRTLGPAMPNWSPPAISPVKYPTGTTR